MFTIRKGRRRVYIKLHTIVDLETLAILNIMLQSFHQLRSVIYDLPFGGVGRIIANKRIGETIGHKL